MSSLHQLHLDILAKGVPMRDRMRDAYMSLKRYALLEPPVSDEERKVRIEKAEYLLTSTYNVLNDNLLAFAPVLDLNTLFLILGYAEKEKAREQRSNPTSPIQALFRKKRNRTRRTQKKETTITKSKSKPINMVFHGGSEHTRQIYNFLVEKAGYKVVYAYTESKQSNFIDITGMDLTKVLTV